MAAGCEVDLIRTLNGLLIGPKSLNLDMDALLQLVQYRPTSNWQLSSCVTVFSISYNAITELA